jgi:hypothetical protein
VGNLTINLFPNLFDKITLCRPISEHFGRFSKTFLAALLKNLVAHGGGVAQWSSHPTDEQKIRV